MQRLRYDVYCGELGRKSPNADHERKLLRDDLDKFAHVFFAEADGQAVATIRGNRPSEGDIGILGELYGMQHSPHYPDHNAIITKFVIARDYRGGSMALRMIAALVRYGEKYDIRECFIDCVPSLLPYYRAIGFKVCGEPFLHRENGLSIPMHLDLVRHGARLARDPTLFGMLLLYAQGKAAEEAWRHADFVSPSPSSCRRRQRPRHDRDGMDRAVRHRRARSRDGAAVVCGGKAQMENRRAHDL